MKMLNFQFANQGACYRDGLYILVVLGQGVCENAQFCDIFYDKGMKVLSLGNENALVWEMNMLYFEI